MSKAATDLTAPGYNPDVLLDWAKQRLQLGSDSRLADALDVAPPVISKIRHRRIPLGLSVLVKLHDLTDAPIRDLRALMFGAATV